MRINRPPATGLQLDRCDVCGDKMHRGKLVRTQVEWLQPAYQNAFIQSSYDGSFWVCDATDAGLISWGNHCDNVRYRINDDNTTSILNGVQTWTGNGTFRCTAIPSTGAATTDNIIFSCWVGPNDLNTSPSMTVALGDCDSSGGTKVVKKTFTISGTSRLWFSWLASEAALGSRYYYIDVTNAGDWWIDELQLEKNSKVRIPGPFFKTSGTAASSTTATGMVSSRKVCPDCFEYVLSKSEKFGRTDEAPVDLPVDTYNQEF